MMGFNLAKIVAAAIKKKLVEMVSQQEDGNTLTPDSTLVESQPTEDIVASLQAQCTQHFDADTR